MAKGVYGVPGLRISGKLNGTVIVPQKNGTVVIRELPDRLPPRTAAQKATAARFKPVAAAWRALSLEELAAWRAYAKNPPAPHPYPSPRGGGNGGQGGGGSSLQPYQAFTALASKCLQMRPEAPVPSLPPTAGFMGDSVIFDLRLSIDDLGIVFRSNAPNGPGVVTELLLQRLKTRARMPVAKAYVTQRFVAFTADALEATVAVEPGVWACAIRFVREATGQETGVVELGVAEVAG